jgi:hypothetical protein
MIRKLLLGFVVVLVIGAAVYLRFHHSRRAIETAYAGNREVTLWSTTAQVREPVATVGFGERLDVLERFGDQTRVRTGSGVAGWTNQDDLLSAEFWRKAQDLEAETAKLAAQARGHTRVLSNLHIGPARDSPRIRQLDRDVAVELFERQAVDVPLASPATVADEGGPGVRPDAQKPEAKQEDWWLVRAHVPKSSTTQGLTLSGWLLGRFVDLDVPSPLPDYASSSGMRIVAWFEVNRVADASGAAKPQYLVIGARGPEGQPCDFRLMRVFTWAKQRQRYETAFLESDLCGKLPMKLSAATSPGGNATFAFEDTSKGKSETRTYRMYQNVVRRVREAGATSTRPARPARPVRRKRARG